VFESPVQSGFLPPRVMDRDRDWSAKVPRPQKTGLDHPGLVQVGFLQSWSGSDHFLVLTSLDRFTTGFLTQYIGY
ncbi:hypothetical protein M413DRAFT_72574, partial [Hebeloma cylindrosporum]